MRRALTTGVAALALLGAGAIGSAVACSDDAPTAPRPEHLDPALVAQGKDIFRFDTFGDEKYWTDTLRMHEIIQQAVSPAAALAVGLRVDVDSLPQAVRDALAAGKVDLNSPATTVTLLKLNAVVGLKGQVQTVGGRDSLVRVGITCALCHSTVDNSFAKGIGRRLDGWPNTELNPGAIVALSPAVAENVKAVLRTWGAGKYDPRINFDGQSTPLVLPPAYGLLGVDKETFTAEGPVSYWNAYVAVTQMHGQGNFSDPRLGINVAQAPDLVTPKLPALRQYQLSLQKPAPPAGSFDVAAAERGRAVFTGAGQCATCHAGSTFTDVNTGKLHAPSETGMDPRYAARTAGKAYRTTPLRGLWQHAPYFHDGSAKTLADVVAHYDRVRSLRLTDQQQRDLVEYLKSL
ncbi:cytochrome c class I (plasmid) [Gemmatirosa kalamazoonensis]|uniref:Cytochrome c class I n=1 Tax=Gemmatirosa kalamazoonensis TaxID=861299 RepID=W0RRY3_9BACT|nr:c-type cytochrome [Gemmatirosa kalamazoonensis]AHG93202.1 cytochrome c class I [Gemmatirosa kalamazoonensis]